MKIENDSTSQDFSEHFGRRALISDPERYQTKPSLEYLMFMAENPEFKLSNYHAPY